MKRLRVALVLSIVAFLGSAVATAELLNRVDALHLIISFAHIAIPSAGMGMFFSMVALHSLGSILLARKLPKPDSKRLYFRTAKRGVVLAFLASLLFGVIVYLSGIGPEHILDTKIPLFWISLSCYSLTTYFLLDLFSLRVEETNVAA